MRDQALRACIFRRSLIGCELPGLLFQSVADRAIFLGIVVILPFVQKAGTSLDKIVHEFQMDQCPERPRKLFIARPEKMRIAYDRAGAHTEKRVLRCPLSATEKIFAEQSLARPAGC